jgi:hypothetical protein
MSVIVGGAKKYATYTKLSLMSTGGTNKMNFGIIKSSTSAYYCGQTLNINSVNPSLITYS